MFATPSTSSTTIVHAVVDASIRWPDRPALVFEDAVVTYRQFLDDVRRAVGWFERSGVARGAKVAVLTTNEPTAMVAAVAALYVGATWIPVNPRDSAADVAALLARAECDVLLVGRAMQGWLGSSEGRIPRVAPLDEVCAGPASASPIAARPDDVAAVFFTGGTTGRSKGAVFPHRNLLALAEAYVELMVEDDDVALAAGPLTHAAGRQCLATLLSGTPTVILPRFDAGQMLRAVARYRVTFTVITPTMLYMLLDHPDLGQHDLSSLRRLGYGAGPIAVARLKEAIRRFGPVLQGVYGQTESPMIISCLRPAEHLREGRLADDARLSSVGRPTRFSDVRIVDRRGVEVGTGEVGEIVVAGAYQMSGYLADPAATAAARWGEFLRTGDLGSFDEDGYLTICGRTKDMIITGGFNVYAAEVENAVADHPDVAEVAVFGVADPVWGESVTAAVVARPGRAVDVGALRHWVHDRLGGVKTPKRFLVMSDLPRNTNGKILKRELVERFAIDNGGRAAAAYPAEGEVGHGRPS
jgi:acyl-CoA synthetase (AMP-forming)/AMP-acid ligase II